MYQLNRVIEEHLVSGENPQEVSLTTRQLKEFYMTTDLDLPSKNNGNTHD
jgi:hypothetical protein